MNIDLVYNFWFSRFEISVDKLPIQECIPETVAVQLLKEQNPQLDFNDDHTVEIFKQLSLKAGLGLRRFVCRDLENSAFYNASRIHPNTSHTKITLSLLNSQGLITQSVNKCDFLHGLITSLPAEHIIAISESHLTPNHGDGEITKYFENYTVHRADRNTEIGRKSKWGGVLLLTSPGILSTKGAEPFSNGCCELSITELNELSITTFCIYRPPDATLDEFKDVLERARTYLNSHPCKDVILLGDFNFPTDVVDWRDTEDGIVPYPKAFRTDGRKEQFQELLNFTDEFYLHQMISKPTRGTNILDLIFTNSTHMLHSPLIIPVPKSDHHLVQLQTDYGASVNKSTRYPDDRPEFAKLNFQLADKTKLKQLLQQADLNGIVDRAQSSKEAKDCLINKIVECSKEAGVPVYQNMPKGNSGKDFRELRKLFKKRMKIVKKMRSKMIYRNQEQRQHELNTINADIIRLQEKSKLEKEKEQIQNLKSNPAAFYKYAKSSQKNSTQIGPLKNMQMGKLTYESDPQKMAQILSNQYESVFTVPNTAPRQYDFNPQAQLSDIEFSPSDIIHTIKEISPTSAPGPDGITPKFLKDYAEELAEPLHLLWRKSLDSGDNPDGTHLAYITAIFKAGDKSEAANYRPVSLTNHITKIFERIIKNELVFYLTRQQLYNETQHGFRKARSTQTNLIEYYESILHQLETNTAVDSIYLDFSKAFDKCDHGIILEKLTALGITGKLHNWIEDFLRNRMQIVVVDGSKSKPVNVISGVPQGSVLGPILFLILMYDITNGINSSILSSFADDTKIWRGVKSQICKIQLQNDLNIIYNWALINNMEFNDKKFQAIRYYVTLDIGSYVDSGGADIAFINNVRDLGIIMSHDLTFKEHINIASAKGKRMAGWILRVFTSRAPYLMKTLLKQLVLPRIEYCCVIWCPSSQELIRQLESVQRYFTKKIYFSEEDTKPDYWERLKILKIFSAERRRERYIIIYTWKVLHNLYPNPGLKLNEVFVNAHDQHPAHGIHIERYNERTGIIIGHIASPTLPKELKAHSILNKCCTLFNCMPSHLRRPTETTASSDFLKFKGCLDKWLATIPDQPTVPGRFRPAQTNSILHQKGYTS